MSSVEKASSSPETWWQKHPVTGLLAGWSVILGSLATWTLLH
jgi:hypothetical protein